MKKSVLPLAVGLALIGTEASATLIVPFGPQNDVSAATVASWGWSECYSATYATPTIAQTALAGCSGDYLMLAAKRTGSDVFEVLAAALWDDVLFNTGTGDYTTTHRANGSEWYYAEDWSWGFAPQGLPVYKNSCDTNRLAPSVRLCWHTHDWIGGWSAGTYTWLNSSTNWTKVILTGGGMEVPEPGTMAMFAIGLMGLGAARRRRSI